MVKPTKKRSLTSSALRLSAASSLSSASCSASRSTSGSGTAGSMSAQLDPVPVAAGFHGVLVPCLVHEYPPHRFGRRGEEVPAAVPRGLPLPPTDCRRGGDMPHARGLSLATFAPASRGPASGPRAVAARRRPAAGAAPRPSDRPVRWPKGCGSLRSSALPLEPVALNLACGRRLRPLLDTRFIAGRQPESRQFAAVEPTIRADRLGARCIHLTTDGISTVIWVPLLCGAERAPTPGAAWRPRPRSYSPLSADQATAV